MITTLWIGEMDLLSGVLGDHLGTEGIESVYFKQAAKLSTGLKLISDDDVDVILLDLFLPDSEGLESFLKVHDSAPEIPKIILVNQSEREILDQAIELGAEDYLVREEISVPLLLRVIRYAVERKKKELELKKLGEEYSGAIRGRTEEVVSSDSGKTTQQAQLQKIEDKLVKSEERYREIVEEITYLIYYTTDVNGCATYVNNPCAEITGYTVDELIGMHYLEMIHPDWRERAQELYRNQFVNRIDETVMDFPINTKSGELKWVEQKVRLLASGDYILGFQGIARDITEQREAENKLRAALSEKEVLLKEVHHRMKNNLLAISGLLHFQEGSIKDMDARKALANCQRRIMSMAVIHEKLYQMEDLAHVNIGDYIRTLADHLVRSFSSSPEKINISVPVDGIRLNVETAVPCGLVITELITNALEYAFPDSGMGTITVTLDEWAHRNFNLTVSDDGIGIPADLDIENADTLGLLLTRTLVDSLGGTMEIKREAGTTFRINFSEYSEGRVEPIADLSPPH